MRIRDAILFAAAFAALVGPGFGADRGIREWIGDLSSPTGLVRQAALAALESAGTAAAVPVRRAAIDGDPAASAAAARAWGRLRWTAAGGIGADEIAPLLGSFGDPATRTAWEAFIARHGAASIHVVAGMADTAGQQENVPRALGMILSAVAARDLAAEIAGDAAPAASRPERALLVETAARIPDAPILARICEILLLLWWYEDVPEVAARAWTASQDETFVRLASAAIRRGGLESSIGAALRGLLAGRGRSTSGAELAFRVRLARETGAAAEVRGCLRPADIERLSPTEADSVIHDGLAMGLGGEMESLLASASSPALLYLRSRVRAAAGKADAAVADMEAAMARIDAGESIVNQPAAFELAEIMERRGDVEPAGRIWTAIAAKPPAGTVQDANALLRLARRAEARGDFRKALSYCEEALQIGRDQGAGTALTAPGGGRGTEWLMRAILDLKRKASTAETPPQR